MDAYQQPHRYMRPPPPPPQPPPTADHHLHHHHFLHQQQTQQAPRPPVPTHGNQWYSNQFHYQHPSSHSPSPPPPPPSQWAPPPASSYPPPPPPSIPYPAHHHNPNINNYPLPPRPPAPLQISQSYPQSNQDWSNPNWGHHQQSWDYTGKQLFSVLPTAVHKIGLPGPKNGPMQGLQWRISICTPSLRQLPDQKNKINFHDQYPQASDFHYVDTQHHSLPASGYQQFPVPAASSQQPPVAYQQETSSISSAPSSYIPDVQLPYTGRDGSSAGEANAGFPHQENLHSSPSVHQQEVPSSYSSVTGNNTLSILNLHVKLVLKTSSVGLIFF
ncbi:hypothetical protein Patl1_16064 [Pistacia atlantica]|uniref:Uncharacterized protein n=1 Tax=Pistacia atlantica TaxID=434234 RepID=A0ACC1BBL9_9ROSI|nr:hypothetical protein Patl1_16064 [Pistacia atlantica]